MTLPKNFPGRKQERRVSALSRKKVNLALLEENFPSKKTEITVLKKEISTLEKCTASGGKKSTKKVGQNLGKMN